MKQPRQPRRRRPSACAFFQVTNIGLVGPGATRSATWGEACHALRERRTVAASAYKAPASTSKRGSGLDLPSISLSSVSKHQTAISRLAIASTAAQTVGLRVQLALQRCTGCTEALPRVSHQAESSGLGPSRAGERRKRRHRLASLPPSLLTTAAPSQPAPQLHNRCASVPASVPAAAGGRGPARAGNHRAWRAGYGPMEGAQRQIFRAPRAPWSSPRSMSTPPPTAAPCRPHRSRSTCTDPRQLTQTPRGLHSRAKPTAPDPQAVGSALTRLVGPFAAAPLRTPGETVRIWIL